MLSGRSCIVCRCGQALYVLEDGIDDEPKMAEVARTYIAVREIDASNDVYLCCDAWVGWEEEMLSWCKQ